MGADLTQMGTDGGRPHVGQMGAGQMGAGLKSGLGRGQRANGGRPKVGIGQRPNGDRPNGDKWGQASWHGWGQASWHAKGRRGGPKVAQMGAGLTAMGEGKCGQGKWEERGAGKVGPELKSRKKNGSDRMRTLSRAMAFLSVCLCPLKFVLKHSGKQTQFRLEALSNGLAALGGGAPWRVKLERKNGGEGGIRTPGRFPYTRFPSVRIRPLCHLSAGSKRVARNAERGARQTGFVENGRVCAT